MFMKKVWKGLLTVALAGVITFAPVAGGTEQLVVSTVYGHGHHGGGGHHGNCGGSYGVNYYYCGGHAAHQHLNGHCPYAALVNNNQSNQTSVKKSTIKKVQKKLKKLGYPCGKAKGIMNKKTQKALRRFQRDHCLKVNGVIKKQTLRALGL